MNLSRLGPLILNAPKTALIGLVLFYQVVLSPVKFALLGPASRCRFEPSCSQYALEALRQHGLLRGSWLAMKRLLRCHPWGAFGPDPVPPVSGGNARAVSIPPAQRGRSGGVRALWIAKRAALRGATRRSATSSTSSHTCC